jgi:hypothetical protein
MSSKPINFVAVVCLLVALILLLIAGIVPSTVFPTGVLAVPGVLCLGVGVFLIVRNRRNS